MTLGIRVKTLRGAAQGAFALAWASLQAQLILVGFGAPGQAGALAQAAAHVGFWASAAALLAGLGIQRLAERDGATERAESADRVAFLGVLGMLSAALATAVAVVVDLAFGR